jgi:AraC-like DNA-binding protein
MTNVHRAVATPDLTPAWRGTAYEPGEWAAMTSECGSRCRFDASRAGYSRLEFEQAGDIAVRNVELGWQSMARDARFAGSRVEQNMTVLAVQRGTLVVEDRHRSVSLKAGDMVLLDASLGHTLLFKDPALCSTVQVPPHVLSERGIPVRFSSGCHPVHANPEVAAVRDLFLTFCAHVSSAGAVVRERVGRQFLDLMDIVVRSSDASFSGRSAESTVLRARQIIARRFGDPDLSLSQIADELHMSSSSLMRAFRDRGLSLMRFANSIRLEHASRMLAGPSRISVQEVAALCGFTSLAHFSRSFRKEHGMAPRDYAALNRDDSVTEPQFPCGSFIKPQ